jgi:hypothetical protein
MKFRRNTGSRAKQPQVERMAAMQIGIALVESDARLDRRHSGIMNPE